jgi:hypothetical protein
MTDDLPRVGILHAPYGAASLAEIARAAQSAFRPVILFRREVAVRCPDVVHAAERLFDIQIIPGERVAKACRPLNLDGLTTYHDGELDHVDAIAGELGLSGVATIDQPWDKLVQRQVLADAGLTGIHASAVGSTSDLNSAVNAIGFPAVLKPRRGVSSSGVALIENQADIEWQYQARNRWDGLLLESQLKPGIHPGHPGKLADYVSVETVSTDIHHHIAIVDKLPLRITRRAGCGGADWIHEMGGQVPTCLPDNVRRAVCDYVSRVLTVLGIRWRLTHTEIRLTPDGPELIEVNGRLAGYLAQMLRIGSGTDLVRTAIGLAAGQEPEISQQPLSSAVMLLKPTFPDRAGVVRSAVTAADLLALPCVARVVEVATAGQPRSAARARMATVLLHAATLGELECAAGHVMQAINSLFAPDLG